MASEVKFSKPYKPIFQISVDFLLFIVQAIIMFVAYLLYTQDLLAPDLTEFLMNDECVVLTLLYLTKFAMDVLIF